jgi:hypothetical protein
MHACLAVSRELRLPRSTTLEVAGLVGWSDARSNGSNFGVGVDAVSNAALSLTLSRPVGGVTLTTGCQWSTVADGALRAATPDPDVFAVVTGFSVEF